MKTETITFTIVDYLADKFMTVIKNKKSVVQKFTQEGFTRFEIRSERPTLDQVCKRWQEVKANTERIDWDSASTHASLQDKIMNNKLKTTKP